MKTTVGSTVYFKLSSQICTGQVLAVGRFKTLIKYSVADGSEILYKTAKWIWNWRITA